MEKTLKINNVLKRLMKENNKTLVSLSKSTRVPKSTISEWLSVPPSTEKSPIYSSKKKTFKNLNRKSQA